MNYFLTRRRLSAAFSSQFAAPKMDSGFHRAFVIAAHGARAEVRNINDLVAGRADLLARCVVASLQASAAVRPDSAAYLVCDPPRAGTLGTLGTLGQGGAGDGGSSGGGGSGSSTASKRGRLCFTSLKQNSIVFGPFIEKSARGAAFLKD